MTQEPVVRIRLFGEPAVLIRGRPVPLPRMQAALLGALVLAGPEGSHADPLADVLWPGTMPKTYETSLRVHVMKLRRSLDDDGAELLVRRDQGGYALRLDLAEVDVRRFSRLVTQARRLHMAGDAPAPAFAAAAEALRLWVGEPYRGLEDAVDVLAARSALQEQRVLACEIVGTDGLAIDRVDAVVEQLGPLFATSPSNERVGLPLIRALVDAGRPGEAVRVANELQHALRTELGVTSQAAADLTDVLQQGRGHGGGPTVDRPPLAVPQSSTPFVGREDELAQLLDRVSTGEGAATVTAVRGPAGIGKTRLLQELAQRAQDAGVAVFFGRADRSQAPYGVVTSMIGRGGGSEEIQGAPGDIVRRLILGRTGDTLPPDPGQSGQAMRSRLHDRIATWLLASDPALIVIDDVQWVDPDTASLLRTVVDRGGRHGCHLVLGWRGGRGDTDVVEQLLSDLTDSAHRTDLLLGPLTKEASADLATHIGVPHVDPVELFERTAGNPLLVREVARLETQDLDPSDLLVDLVSRRFLADGAARDLLRTAAVLGDRFTIADLLSVTELPTEAARQALSDCEREGILVLDGDGRAEFAHSVVAEIILSSLSAVDRQRLHLQAFESLTRSGGDDLALHARAAFPFIDAAEAVRSIASAAADAQRRLAFERASILHEQAIELQEETHALAPSEAVALFIEQARSLAHTAEGPCDDVRRRAVPVAAGAASPSAAADLAEANVGRSLAGAAEIVDLLAAALHWSPDPVTSVRIRARLALEQAESDRSNGAHRRALQALRDADETGDLRAIGPAQRAVVSTGLHRLPGEEYRQLVSDLVDTARAVPDLDLEMIGLIHLVVDRLRHRETEAAVSTLRGLQILADDRRWPRYQSFATGIAAVVALARGDRAEFERRSAQATELANHCGFEDAAVMVAGQKTCLAWHDGSLPELADILATLHDTTGRLPVVAAALACARAEAGQLDEAGRVAESIDHPSLPRGMLYSTCLALLASYALTAGDVDMAEDLRAPLSDLAGTDIVAGAGVGHFGPAEGFLGRVHLTLGDRERAAVAFDEAAHSARSHQQTLALHRLARDRAVARL